MSSALLSIQGAIYNILTSDAPLMAKVSGVFDFVADNHAYPFITIGESTSIPYETFDRHGEETTVVFHIWSRYLGFKEIDQITSDCNRLLSRKEFPITD